MQEKALVSFIVGVYNTKNFEELEYSIQQMLNQTYKNVEIIICDDCSTNGVFEFLKEKYGKNAQIKLIRNEKNSGLGVSLNHCLEYAKGEFIARQDDDDYCDITRIEKQVNFLEKNPEYSLVSACLEKYDEEGVWEQLYTKERPSKRDFRKCSQHVHAATLFRRECLLAVDGYRISKETTRAEDYDLFMRIYARGMKGYNIQEILYFYNTPRNGKKSSKYRYRIYEAIVRFKGFKALKLPIQDYIYVLRPLIAGLMTEKMKQRIKKILSKG